MFNHGKKCCIVIYTGSHKAHIWLMLLFIYNIILCNFANKKKQNYISSDSYAWIEHTKIAISIFHTNGESNCSNISKVIRCTLTMCTKNVVSLYLLHFLFPFTCFLVFLTFLPQWLIAFFSLPHFKPTRDGFYLIEIKFWGLYQSQKKINISSNRITQPVKFKPITHTKINAQITS